MGQLPALAHAFALSLLEHEVARPGGIAEVVAAILVALSIVVSWIGLGDLLRRLWHRRSGSDDRDRWSALAVAQTCGLGAGASSLVWFGLGVTGCYRAPVAVVAACAGLALFALTAARRPLAPWSRVSSAPLARVEWAALVGLVFPAALAFVVALAPPTAKDALIYHRALPKAFVAGGGLVDVPYNIAGFFALGAEMHGVWAMLLGGLVGERVAEMAFGVVEFAFFPLLLLALYGWVRQIGLDRSWALTAAALFAGIPTAYTVAASGDIDLALTLYATLAIQAAAEFWTTGEGAPLARLAVFLGCALAVKHTAVFLFVPMPLLVLLRARRDERSPGPRPTDSSGILARAAIALGCAGLIGSVWYVRTWIRTGSPLFPFYMNVWPGQAPGWDKERSLLIQSLLSVYGGAGKGVLDYLAVPVRLSLLGQPEDAAYYEGVLGISFLFGLPLLLWVACQRSLPPAAGVAAGVATLMYGQWLVSLQGLRYLLPVLSLLAVALISAGAGARIRFGVPASTVLWTALATTVAGHLVAAAWFLEQNPVRVVLGGEDRATYLERRLDYYPYYRIVNASLPAGSQVWLINMRRDTYHIDRPYFADYLFEDYTLRKWVEAARDAGDVRAQTAAAGITHVLVRHDVLFDPARSPVVDDRRPAAVNDAKMGILKSFLLEGTTVLRSDAKFLLVALPPHPAPPPRAFFRRPDPADRALSAHRRHASFARSSARRRRPPHPPALAAPGSTRPDTWTSRDWPSDSPRPSSRDATTTAGTTGSAWE